MTARSHTRSARNERRRQARRLLQLIARKQRQARYVPKDLDPR